MLQLTLQTHVTHSCIERELALASILQKPEHVSLKLVDLCTEVK